MAYTDQMGLKMISTDETSRGGSRKPTIEEAEAILTLLRGGWLKLELTVGASEPAAAWRNGVYVEVEKL